MTNRVIVPARHAALDGGIDFSESITGLLKCWQIRALSFTRGHLFVLEQTRITGCLSSSHPALCSLLCFSTIFPSDQSPNFKATEPEFVNLLRGSGKDFQPGGPVQQPYLTYRHARLHRLAESIPWKRFLGFFNVFKYTGSGKVCLWYPFLKVRLYPFLPITFCM